MSNAVPEDEWTVIEMTMTQPPSPAWQPVKRSRAHELVIDAIEEQIMDGVLRVGDPLPSERELASRLEVSRAGVREAIRVLESDGILRSQRGTGAEAGTFVSALPRQALTRLLRLHVALTNFAMDDVVDARVVLERFSSELATAHATPEALAAIRDALHRMDTPGVSREVFNDADTDFHLAIADAGGNELVASLTAAIRGSLRVPILEAMGAIEDWHQLANQLRSEHHAIMNAIEAGDGPAAAQLAEAHIRSSAATLPAAFGRRQATRGTTRNNPAAPPGKLHSSARRESW